MWIIDKQFNFCYGHRVYVQTLNTSLTAQGHTQPKCRHLHGHEGKVHVYLQAKELNQQGMVEDFVHLGWLKDFIDNTIDHKFIIDKFDPMFNFLVADVWNMANFNKTTYPQMLADVFVDNHFVGEVIDVRGVESEHLKETLSGYLVVDFVPTSENLAKWMFDIVQAKMSHVEVSRVDWWETPKSRSSYAKQHAE